MNRFTFRSTILARLLVGAAQGLALYLLALSMQEKVWPSTDLRIYDALLNVARYLPILAIVTIGNQRVRTATLWLSLALVVCAGVGFYTGYRDPTPRVDNFFSWISWLNISFGLSMILFIGQSLVTAGDADRRAIATFPTYFDVAWCLATQYALTILFVCLLWGILWLGAFLFRAIGIEVFIKTIVKPWFYLPVSAMASSVALHLTDAHAGLVRGARSLVLNLLAWLMPLLGLISVAFLVALLFTGLQPLWNTKTATASLLTATVALILLINSHFQDGTGEAGKGRPLIYARLVAALVLTPLVALAAYGLLLRVEQYGWTPSRVIAAAIVVLCACHAIGYALAAVTSGVSLRLLPKTNIVSALVGVAVILALLTPVADPARLSVDSQVGRLESGAISPDKFDFDFLHLRSARFGHEALERLKAKKDGPNAAAIAEKASRALTPLSPTASIIAGAAQPAATTETRTKNITPVGDNPPSLPEDFLRQDWSGEKDKARLPTCLTQATTLACQATVLDLTRDGTPAIVLTSNTSAWVFAKMGDKWRFLGTLGNTFCSGVHDALKAGKVTFVPAVLPNDVEANGVRLPLMNGCPPTNR